MLQAKSIWIENKEREMNIHAVFCTKIETEKEAVLHIGGTAFYRIWVNGEFIGAGPARTAKGYLREDILLVGSGKKEIIIEAVGYYCHSISTVKQTSLIIAEVQCNGEVIAYTGRDFEGFLPECKVQKTERYSV